MKMFLDCLPCVLNQILDASRMSSADERLHAEILKEGFALLARYEEYHSSPDLVADMHKIVKRVTGVADPYAQTKARDIKAALEVYPALTAFLDDDSIDLTGEACSEADLGCIKMYRALKIAVTGNILDSAIMKDIDLARSLDEELKRPFVLCDLSLFLEKLRSAKTILIIADNAGEAVFDRVLIEYLDHKDLIYAVRDVPIINDLTIEDARAAGVDRCACVISCGSDAPGAILSRCDEELRAIFDRADIVISKGQGNFEALSDCGRDVFFLLKAKCAMIAKRLDVRIGDYVFFRGGHDEPGT